MQYSHIFWEVNTHKGHLGSTKVIESYKDFLAPAVRNKCIGLSHTNELSKAKTDLSHHKSFLFKT